MPRYLRIDEPTNVPRHRFVGYIHFLNTFAPTTRTEYMGNVIIYYGRFKPQSWSKFAEDEAMEALRWLVDNGLAKEVE